MREIVNRLQENHQIELAKSILESNGYSVTKIKESDNKSDTGDISYDEFKRIILSDENARYKYVGRAYIVDACDNYIRCESYIRYLPSKSTLKSERSHNIDFDEENSHIYYEGEDNKQHLVVCTPEQFRVALSLVRSYRFNRDE